MKRGGGREARGARGGRGEGAGPLLLPWDRRHHPSAKPLLNAVPTKPSQGPAERAGLRGAAPPSRPAHASGS